MALRRTALVAVALAALGLLAAVAWIVLGSPPSPAFVHRSTAGGFELDLPRGWEEGDGHDEDAESPYLWFEARHPTRLGAANGWLYVSRGPVNDPDPLAVGRDHALADIRARYGDVKVRTTEVTVDGRPGIRLRYTRPIVRALAFLPVGDAEEVRYVTVRDRHVYEIGVVSWGQLPSELASIIDDLDLFPPAGTRTVLDRDVGFAVDIPGSWDRHDVRDYDLGKAVWVASTPGSMPDQWAVLWRHEQSYDDAVEASLHEVTDRGGRLVDRASSRVDGHPATRVDFDRHIKDAGGDAHFSTWIIDGPDGRAWQLLVGSLADERRTAARVAASFRFLDRSPET